MRCYRSSRPSERRRIEAFVVLMPDFNGNDSLTDELQQWVKTNFAAHAFPRKTHYVKELPKLPAENSKISSEKKRREDLS